MSLSNLLKDNSKQIVNLVLRRFFQQLMPKEKTPIVKWCHDNVDMSLLPTSSATGPFIPKPYQVEPMEATEAPDCKEITLSWGQRLGKSTVWTMSLLKRVADGGLSGLILYPTVEMGLKINADSVLPLLNTIDEAKKDLAIRGGKKKDSYHIPSLSSIIYFLGGGSQVISYTANWCVIDETDFVALRNADAEGENMSQLRALRLRMQTYANRLLIACSSPTTYTGTIYTNWKQGSRGVWNWRCLECGKLYPVNQLSFIQQDGSYAGLQWKKTESGDVIEESIRWICPACHHAHQFSDAYEMNRLGCYVHENPANKKHRSFTVGALANPASWSWLDVANAQEAATDPDGKKFLCNTILGKPYKHVREGDLTLSIDDTLHSKCVGYPEDLNDKLSIVVAAVDQQKSELAGMKYFVFIVRGWDEEGNSYLLNQGTANSLEALGAYLDQDYYSHKVSLIMIDQGGFDNSQDTDYFVNSRANAFYYKGDDERTLKGQAWIPSQTQQKLFLANAVRYQVKLLSLLYDPPRPVGYKWNLPLEIPASYTDQIVSVAPNYHRIKDNNGQAYQNWCTMGAARRDFFDAEKMALVALDVACFYLPAASFRKGNKPLFIRKEWLLELQRANLIRKK